MPDDTALHRTGVVNPLGNLTNDVGRLKVADPVFEALLQARRKTGLPYLAIVNEVLGIWALGREAYDSLQKERGDVLEGKWRERG